MEQRVFTNRVNSLFVPLMPRAGDLRALRSYQPALSSRLQILKDEPAEEEKVNRAEEAMLTQVCAWLALGNTPVELDDAGTDEARLEEEVRFEYSPELTFSLFALGRIYYEAGFLLPAERIFAGLIAADNRLATPARVGFGVLRLEFGNFDEAATHFRRSLELGQERIACKLGLVCAFLGQGELGRALSLMAEVSAEILLEPPMTKELDGLFCFLRMLVDSRH